MLIWLWWETAFHMDYIFFFLNFKLKEALLIKYSGVTLGSGFEDWLFQLFM